MPKAANKKSTQTRKAPSSKPRAAKRTPAPKKPKLILTAPPSAEKKAAEKLAITGYEDDAAAIRKKLLKLDALTTEVKELKAELIEAVTQERLDAEIAGNFHKTCAVDSTDGHPVLVIFQDKYSKISTEHEEALRAHLNSHYETLITRDYEVKVKKATTLDALKTALGNKWDAFAALVDVTEFLKPSNDFMQKRAELRSTMTKAENKAVDAIVEQCRNAPQVKVK